MQTKNPLPCFVISLKSHPERCDIYPELFKAVGLHPEHFEGVDGSQAIQLRRGGGGSASAHLCTEGASLVLWLITACGSMFTKKVMNALPYLKMMPDRSPALKNY